MLAYLPMGAHGVGHFRTVDDDGAGDFRTVDKDGAGDFRTVNKDWMEGSLFLFDEEGSWPRDNRFAGFEA